MEFVAKMAQNIFFSGDRRIYAANDSMSPTVTVKLIVSLFQSLINDRKTISVIGVQYVVFKH